jgi:2-aminoethylphosphonate dioxygenase
MKLSNFQINNYYNDGFILLKKFFSKKDIKIISNELNNIIDTNNKKIYLYFTRSKINKKLILNRIENFYENNKKIKQILDKKLKDTIYQITKSKVNIFKDKVNVKSPGAVGFEPHQDLTIWQNMYNIKEFITVAVTIDKSNKENGCLEMSPKSHMLGQLSKLEKAIPIKKVRKLKWIKLITLPGDIVIFNDKTAHRSESNLSNKSRRMLFLTYNNVKYGNKIKKYFSDKIKNYPPNNLRKKNVKYNWKI